MSYTDTLAVLAASSERAVVALYARLETGELTEDEFVALATAALLRASYRGAALADVALAAYLSVARGEAVPALGLAPRQDQRGRLTAAVRGLLAGRASSPDPAEAARVLGRAEPLAVAQDTYGQGMRRHGVRRWTRVLNTGACKLCQTLAGVVLPASADMYHHKGCGCTQRPVQEENR